MATRAQVYQRGLTAAEAAEELKKLSKRVRRPVKVLWEIADQISTGSVHRELEAIAYAAGRSKSKNVSKTLLAEGIGHFRAIAKLALRRLAGFKTTGAARASQQRQLDALGAWIRASAPRRVRARK